MAGGYRALAARSKRKYLIIGALAVLILILLIVIIYVATKKDDDDDHHRRPHPMEDYFRRAASVSDSATCSNVGKDILMMSGSNAVDAAVAMLFCTGVIHLQSTGIGGGGFMVVYLRSTKKTMTFDYREVAPGAATTDMYTNASSQVGPLAVGVPGEVKGLYEVHSKYGGGGVSWRDVVEPSVKLLENGFPVSKALAKNIKTMADRAKNDPGLRELLFDGNGNYLKEGDTMKDMKLAATFKEIQNNPHSFYNGSLATKIAKDFQNNSGIITEMDLKNYMVKVRPPLSSMFNGMKVHMMEPPSGGIVCAMILNILEELTLKESTDASVELENLHKMLQAMKFAYARRGFLGDSSFMPQNFSKVVDVMLNKTVAKLIARNKFNASTNFPDISYYGGYFAPDDFGTTHVSVLDDQGNAVSATSSINYWFGALYRSTTTGIIYNNEMDDFSSPNGKSNLFGYPPTSANYIVPGKRPLSSMSPLIVTNSSGDVTAIIGAAGGARIISSVAMVLARALLMDEDIESAVEAPRVHNQVVPNVTQYEEHPHSLPQDLKDGLTNLGYSLQQRSFISVVQAILRRGDKIYAHSDSRKGGKAAGY